MKAVNLLLQGLPGKPREGKKLEAQVLSSSSWSNRFCGRLLVLAPADQHHCQRRLLPNSVQPALFTRLVSGASPGSTKQLGIWQFAHGLRR